MGVITSAILAAVTIGGTVNSAVQARRADKAQKKQTRANNRIQERRAQREKLDQLRQARIAAAQAQNLGAVTGAENSSSTQGAVGSIGAQYGANVGYIDSNMQDAREAAFWGNRASSYMSDAATSGAVGSLAGAAFTQLGGMDDLQTAWQNKFGSKG